METEQQTVPVLDAEEIRVIGALMEKSKTTPEYYPMTINGLTAACNQKTSRKPVVNYDEATIVQILDRLKRKGLVSTATGSGIRSTKYKHNLALKFPFTPDELAVLCLLFLRGPLTPGELNSNSGRLYEFDSLEEVQQVLEKLSAGETVFVKQLPRQSGQKEMRYMHLFGSETLIEEYLAEPEAPAKVSTELELRLSAVELELAELKAAFNALMKELNG
ncbi:MAG TPA: YceH family protein [Chitinophagaceae bacterium]|nr:YceH family protein [Chitinophagaceae bacterium]